MGSGTNSRDRTSQPAADEQIGSGEHDSVPGAVLTTGRMVALSATFAAGLLLWTSFPVLNWWWAAVLAFALLGAVLVRAAITPAGGLGYGVLFGLAFYAPLLRWTGDFVGVWPWLALAGICAVFPGMFGLLAVFVRGLPGWPIWLAALWAAQEWAKSSWPVGGFPWGAVGFGQTTGPLLPLVALGGVPLLSAAVVLVGCSAAAVMIAVMRAWRDSEPAARGRTAVWAPVTCVCSVVLATVAMGVQMRGSESRAGGGPVVVAAVQGNVPRLGYDFNAQRRAVLDNHVDETLRLAEDVKTGHAPQPRLVIWPENSSDIDPLTNPDAAGEIKHATEAIRAPIVVGMIRAAPGATGAYPSSWTNTAWVFDPRTGWGERHDKAIIQPFGEYLPWPGLFRHLSEHADDAGHFVAGHGDGVVHAAGIPVGVSTCWEVLFDRAPRRAVLAGAQLLAVPTNNATYDATMSAQQLAVATERAVEHNRYVVVAGTTGISAIIAPDGHELGRTRFNQAAYLDDTIHLHTRLTPATRWGPLVQWLLVGIGAAAITAASVRKYRRRRAG